MLSTKPSAQQPATKSAAPARHWPSWGYALVGVLGGTALIGWHGSRFGNWIIDDAAITFAYARTVAEGHGVALQPGADPSEGFSNPSWFLLLVLGRLIGLFDHGTILGVPDYVLFPKALALICCAGIVLACYYAARKVTRWAGLTALVSGALMAANPSFVIWCFSGLENSLFALAVTWLAVVMFRAAVDERFLDGRTALIAGALAALAALTRPDGLIYVAAYPLVVLLFVDRANLGTSIRSTLLSAAAFAAPVGAYFTWRYLEFGKLLSLPALAKNQELPEFTDLSRSDELLQYVGAPAGIAFAVLVGMVLLRPSRLRAGMIPLLVTLTLAVVAFAVLKPDWMGQQRFATPVWALGALAGTLAAGAVLRHSGVRGRVVLSAGLVVVFILSGNLFAAASEKFREAPTVPTCVVAERWGRIFNAYADIAGVDQGSLLLPDVGGAALTSRLRVVDMAGLTEPRMAEFWADQQWAELNDYVFEEVRPTFVHAHGAWGGSIVADPRFDRDYVEIRSLDKKGVDRVRRDAVPNPLVLEELLAYAKNQVPAIEAAAASAPLGHCGARLRPGELPTVPAR
ncbi:hypothetical protein SAMN05216266_1275 [Amycolatopsis marina]|uniref:Dolichyl-phosphate-mannose-protein mannosyltransferase n=1 Tax=Amycolatopsis marina TaxID=490629 RepID=A0A1I1CFZ8_9PSEU|nr:hypothetical protein [Amycolatopsis marina]SFB60972.1 hypothetical protein SAMN05216266_1275 [Amycolatopsis marina]